MAKIKIALVIIFLIALFFRFWRLSDVPSSLSMDEIAFGWNAESILKTGMDEFGIRYPLSFKSVGDYKPPLGIYVISPSISAFGLNEFAVRFPAAIFGAMTAVVFVFLLRSLEFKWSGSLAGGLWLAINPMHVFLSRTSFHGIISVFFLILGTYAFLGLLKKSSVSFLTLSIVSFSISFWGYYSERVFTPILFVFLVIYFRKQLSVIFKNKSKLIIPVVILLIFATTFILALHSGQGVVSRASDLWIGKDTTTSWPKQYFAYFDLNLWFYKAMNFTLPGYPDLGFLYVADLPLFLFGIYALVRSKNKFVKQLAFMWFLIGPLAGSLTRGGIKPERVLDWLPFFGIVMASSYELILSKSRSWKVIVLYIVFVLWCSAFFWDMLVNNFPKYYADLWHFGYKEVSIYACENHEKYDKIIITDKYGIYWPSVKTIPYLYVLFYCHWDPQTYLTNKSLYNIEFRQPQWRIDSMEKNWLLIGSRWDFPEDFDKRRIMKEIDFPNTGNAAFYFVETKDSDFRFKK